MTVQLPALPYELDDLEPYISEMTLKFHYGKHHRAYVTKLNTLIGNTSWNQKSAFEILISATNQEIFNNAAQVWNHTFFFRCLNPKTTSGNAPLLFDQLRRDFGSYDSFRDEFISTAISHFGSGWAWLVHDGNRLKVTSTNNANTPFALNEFPLLTVDLWEHAYYLDHQNRRDDYVKVVLDHLLNWDFAEKNYSRCLLGKCSPTESGLEILSPSEKFRPLDSQ